MPPEGREVEFSKFDTSRLSRHRLNCSNRAETLHSLLNYQSLEENQRKETIGEIVHFILRPTVSARVNNSVGELRPDLPSEKSS